MNLLHLQKQKGDGHLFVVSLPGWEDVPFKLPSVRRTQHFSAAIMLAQRPADLVTLYEQIFRECILDEDLAFHRDQIPAGIVESIAKLILFLAGTGENAIEYTQGLYNTYRAQAMIPLTFMKRTICSAFGAYTFEHLDDLDYQSVCELFVQAERLMIDGNIIAEEYELLRPGEQPVQKMANADDFVSDGIDPQGRKGPRPSQSPAVQEAMREASRSALREARIKAAREQAERAKNKR